MALSIAQIQTALATPRTFNSLTAQQQSDVAAALQRISDQPYSDAQAAFFKNCWMLVTQAQIDAANAVLPPFVQIAPYSLAGQLYINFGLAIDAIDPDSPYHRFLNAAKTIPVQYTTAITDDVAAKQALGRRPGGTA